jgi:hypothetical protein
MTGTIVAIIYAGAVCECRNGRDCAVLMQALVGGFGMGLADRWGRQKTIIYYSVISIIGEYRCAFLRNPQTKFQVACFKLRRSTSQ